jgi:glutamate synthase (NADPH) large chain
VVAILGKTGRNFAAGMSGGVAYVWDAEREFHRYCNMEMVDFDVMEYEDFESLRVLVDNHYKYTGSSVARRVLDEWGYVSGQFVKVMPRDYKKVLQKRKEKERQKEMI